MNKKIKSLKEYIDKKIWEECDEALLDACFSSIYTNLSVYQLHYNNAIPLRAMGNIEFLIKDMARVL